MEVPGVACGTSFINDFGMTEIESPLTRKSLISSGGPDGYAWYWRM
jgi:hypothetical protein